MLVMSYMKKKKKSDVKDYNRTLEMTVCWRPKIIILSCLSLSAARVKKTAINYLPKLVIFRSLFTCP